VTGVAPEYWLPYLGERAGRGWNELEDFWRSGTPRFEGRQSRDIADR